MRRSAVFAIGTAALLGAAPALAHHSFAMFDLTKEVTIEGTVKDFQWTNPHVWIQLLAPDGKGGSQEWGVEAGAPGMLIRTGWKSSMLTPGDKVVLTLHPLKSGASNGSLVKVVLPDGRTMGPGGPPPPPRKPAGD